MASASTQSANEPAKDFTLVKAQISGRMVSSDVAFGSVHFETRLKKMKNIIIMNESQETIVFSRHQKLTAAMKMRPEK